MIPNYKIIYTDIIQQNHPNKLEQCRQILEKEKLSVFDVIRLNNIIFGKQFSKNAHNQKFRSYDQTAILKILKFQEIHNLNNTEVANHFGISRNTIAKWHKLFSA